VRALVHLGRLGEEGAVDTARLLAREIDNPALEELLAGAHTRVHTVPRHRVSG
jgi:hypothetical protein